MRRVKTLYLHQQEIDLVWQDEFVAAMGDRHDLSIYDERKPLAPQFDGIEVVIDQGGSVGTHEMMDAATTTRLWQVLGTGLDHVDIDYMKSRGFIVTHCPGFLSGVALAEAALMFMLLLSRKFHEATDNFKASVPYRPTGVNLEGRVLALVGFGASGRQLARRAKPFGMRIQAVDVREIELEVLEEIEPELMGTPDDLDDITAGCDFLSLHLPLDDETRHTIDARRIGLMKPTACIINVARGGLVDEDAMHDALLSGRLGGAGIDVFSAEPPDPTLPVYQLPNVFVTPHIAGETIHTVKYRSAAMAENVDRVAQGLEPLYRVDQ